MNGAGMNGHIMSDSDIVADMRRTGLMGHVNTTAVLDVRAVTYRDGGHVASDNSVEPYGTLITHRHITDDRGVLTEITVLAPFGRQTSVTLY